MDHDEPCGQAAGHVLGTLSPDERAEFLAHVSECADCAAAVFSLAPVVAALAYEAPPADPPEGARDRLLARIRSGNVSQPLKATAIADAGLKPRVTFSQRPWLVAAASLAVAVGVGTYSVGLRDRVGTLEQQLRDIGARSDERERQLDAARQAAAEAQTFVVVLAASDLVRVELAGQRLAPQASARAFWSRSGGLIFTASNLPPLPGGRTYQLWIVTPGAPVSAGLLKPGEKGEVHGVFATPRDVTTLAAIAVTIEPEGGVSAPTGEKYLIGLAR